MPPAVCITGEEKTGYLWRLSSRRLVYTPEWKRKYMVLSMSGYLYYYDNKTSQGGGRGSGVIDLRCVMDCVEAPLTDHKKATNVFILIAKQRGFFNQGRHYLSAETLYDMKDWVKKIKIVLTNLSEPKKTGVITSALEHQSVIVPEPLYASIKEESIHRSNSMSTLPSLYKDDQRDGDFLNRSMDDCPMTGLGQIDHNLTYSYSSSDDSLNESFSFNFNQKNPRFSETHSDRQPVNNNEYYSNKSLKSPNYESIKSSPLYARPVVRHSTPRKGSDTSDYIKKMYEDMERVDKQLEMVARIESDREMGDSEGSVNTVLNYVDDGAEVDGANIVEHDKLAKIEAVMTTLNAESEKISQMLTKIQNKLSTADKHGHDSQTHSDSSKLIAMVANYQKAAAEIQKYAKELLLEIHATHTKVLKSLGEAEQAKQSFLDLRTQAENLLSQLQEQAKILNPTLDLNDGSASHPPVFTSYSQTYPRAGPILSSPVRTADGVDTTKDVNIEGPVYAQVKKTKSQAVRRRSFNNSSNSCSPQLSPLRNRNVNTDSRYVNTNRIMNTDNRIVNTDRLVNTGNINRLSDNRSINADNASTVNTQVRKKLTFEANI